MIKTVCRGQSLLLTIMLTGNADVDKAAVASFDFKSAIGVDVLFAEKVVETPHKPFVFYIGPEGMFSHSLQGNELCFWKETATVEDVPE